MNSNNPLAVEPESENDTARESFFAFSFIISLRLKRRLQRRQKRISSNDQHVDTCGNAWCVDDRGNFRNCQHRHFRKRRPMRNAARSNRECRSDYMAHCSSVPPGGEARCNACRRTCRALSPGCQSAVRAVEAPAAAPKAESAPARAQDRVRSGGRRAGRNPRLPSCAARRAKHGGEKADQCADLPRSAAPAAPTIQRSAPACRPAAPRRCNAWKRTRQSSRRLASRRSRPPAAAQRRQPAAPRRGAAGGRAAAAAGGARSDRAAADAPARRTVRAALGLRRRCPLDLRRRRARRRPHRAMPRDQRRLAFAGMQGRAVASSPRNKSQRLAGGLPNRRPPIIRRERRGSTELAGPTRRYNKTT